VCACVRDTAKAPAAVAPAFTATPSIHQAGDGTVEFEVRLTSCPAPTVQWYRGTTAISDGGRYRAVTHTDGVNYVLTLTISGVTKDDGGEYKVVAKTPAGESNANITLNLEGSPAVTHAHAVKRPQVIKR